MMGIFIAEDCTGNFVLENSVCSKNRTDILNDGGPLCSFLVNGKNFPNNGVLKNLSPTSRSSLFEVSRGISQRFDPLENPLFTLRARAAAGLEICVSACAGCGIKEDSSERFLKCGKCLSVVYCSAVCQKKSWKEGHKAVCELRVKNPSKLDPTVDVNSHR